MLSTISAGLGIGTDVLIVGSLYWLCRNRTGSMQYDSFPPRESTASRLPYLNLGSTLSSSIAWSWGSTEVYYRRM